jgi:hypothetical protein
MNGSLEDLPYLEATLSTRRPEDGGRTHPIRTGYRPNWWLPGETGNAWAGGTIEVVGGNQLAPGETGTIRIYPFNPEVWANVRVGARLEVCEGPVLIGKSTVTRIGPANAPAAAG